MHIAYSALRETKKRSKDSKVLNQRMDAYQATCNKYSNEIAAIQKYMPGWLPQFDPFVNDIAYYTL
jgi:predicted metal-dependent peptidase